MSCARRQSAGLGWAAVLGAAILLGATAGNLWACPPSPPPAAPSDLFAVSISSSTIDLHWIDNSDNEERFDVYRSPNAGESWNRFASVGANVTDYTNEGLAAGTRYWYRVQAWKPMTYSRSDYSNVADAWTRPQAPSNLAAVARTSRRIDLSWMDNSTGELGFTILRSLNGSYYLPVGAVGPNTTYFAHKGLPASTPHSYRVFATNAGGASNTTSAVSATTLSPGIFSETWDAVTTPVAPSRYPASASGAVAGSDAPWTWRTENASVADAGFRPTTPTLEAGRFSAGSQSGRFELVGSSPNPFNFTTSDTLSVRFEAKVDSVGTDEERLFALDVRSETDYGAGGAGISILLNADTDEPALTIRATDVSGNDDSVEASSGLGDFGGADNYWVEASFTRNGGSLAVDYALYNDANILEPVLSDSGTIDESPTLALDRVFLTFPRRAVGSFDDVELRADIPGGGQMRMAGGGPTPTPEPPLDGATLGLYLDSEGYVRQDAPFYRTDPSEPDPRDAGRVKILESRVFLDYDRNPAEHDAFIASLGGYGQDDLPSFEEVERFDDLALPRIFSVSSGTLTVMREGSASPESYSLVGARRTVRGPMAGWENVTVLAPGVTLPPRPTDPDEPWEVDEGDFCRLLIPPNGHYYITDTPPKASSTETSDSGYCAKLYLYDSSGTLSARLTYESVFDLRAFSPSGDSVFVGSTDAHRDETEKQFIRLQVIDPEGRVSDHFDVSHPNEFSWRFSIDPADETGFFLLLSDSISHYRVESHKFVKKWEIKAASLFRDAPASGATYIPEELQYALSPASRHGYARFLARSPLGSRGIPIQTCEIHFDREGLVLVNRLVRKWVRTWKVAPEPPPGYRMIEPLMFPDGTPNTRATTAERGETSPSIGEPKPFQLYPWRRTEPHDLYNTKSFKGFLNDSIYVYLDTDIQGLPIRENGEVYVKFLDIETNRVVARCPIRLLKSISTSHIPLNLQVRPGFVEVSSPATTRPFESNAEVIRYEVSK